MISFAGTLSLKFEKVMEVEHCSSKDSHREFTTKNYQLTTYPKQEWTLVVKSRPETEDMGHGRVLKDVDKLLADYNGKLVADCRKSTSSKDFQEAKVPKIQRPEVIAIVLYTGPMVRRYFRSSCLSRLLITRHSAQFQVYNAVLRRFPQSDYEQLCMDGNLYSTTIYVLVSAVLNIARETKLAAGLKLYRGLGGDKLFPPTFFKSDEKGRKGILEWGFMSTTAAKSVAIQYSGITEGKPYATIFEIDSGTVDRGADLTNFSQYPGFHLSTAHKQI